jgi:hypothetical protein
MRELFSLSEIHHSYFKPRLVHIILASTKKQLITKKLEMLQDVYRENEIEINSLEGELRAINDFEIRHAMQEKKIFETLNHEKPSKSFIEIANAIKKNDDILSILNDTGTPFVSENDREQYITNFYSNLYRKDEGVGGEVEDFLGEEICAHPVVSESKLKNHEKEALEADLTLDKLTKALGESNMRSAPGIDGFSNKYIYKFWYFLKYSLFKCCKESLESGSPVSSFTTAQIRIIPKQGDITKLKNWRPISLLSNFYKILSRAINNRLKTVANRVLSRAQKGFTRSRQIQEVILNIDETVSKCNREKLKAAMICVDQAKAFDSVDHQYMLKVFRFFNFGPKFIGWLQTIGTGRKACLILCGGKTTDSFDILKGTAQGDCPSPIIYNICAQILIFKIELDNRIRKLPIFNDMQEPVPCEEIFRQECNYTHVFRLFGSVGSKRKS